MKHTTEALHTLEESQIMMWDNERSEKTGLTAVPQVQPQITHMNSESAHRGITGRTEKEN